MKKKQLFLFIILISTQLFTSLSLAQQILNPGFKTSAIQEKIYTDSLVIRSDSYGCVGNGKVESAALNDACFEKMILACGPRCALQFTGGDFYFSKRKAINFANDTDRSLSIMGIGKDKTNLIFTNTDGLEVIYSAFRRNNVQFRDFSIYQAGYNVGIGIRVVGNYKGVNQSEPLAFDNVALRALHPVHGGWNIGTQLDSIRFVNFNGYTFDAKSSTVGTGLILQGKAKNPGETGEDYWGIQFQLAHCEFLGGELGIKYGDYIQGVEIVSSRFDGVQSAVIVDSFGAAQLSIYGSTINTKSFGIVVTKPLPQFLYSNNVQNVPAARVGIYLMEYTTGNITNSQFTGPGADAGAFAIYAFENKPANINVARNQFSNFNAGVFLGQGTSGYEIFDNQFSNVAYPVAEVAKGTHSVNLENPKAAPLANYATPQKTQPRTFDANSLFASKYGCQGDGKTSNDLCISKMLAACVQSCKIVFGPGEYLFTKSIQKNFIESASTNFTIEGQSQGITKFIFRGTDGIYARLAKTKASSIVLRDLSLIQMNDQVGIGINIFGQGNADNESVQFQNVTLYSDLYVAGKGGWLAGISLTNVSNVKLNGLFVLISGYRGEGLSQYGTGLQIQGDLTQKVPAKNFNMTNSIFLNQSVGIAISGQVQNLQIVNSEFTNMDTYLYVRGENNAGLSIVNSQMDTQKFGMVAEGAIQDFKYINNLQYVPKAVTGLYFKAAVQGIIFDSDIGGKGKNTGSFGIYATASSQNYSLLISTNRIAGFNAGVFLEKGSRGITLNRNSYLGTGITLSEYNVANFGESDNIVIP